MVYYSIGFLLGQRVDGVSFDELRGSFVVIGSVICCDLTPQRLLRAMPHALKA